MSIVAGFGKRRISWKTLVRTLYRYNITKFCLVSLISNVLLSIDTQPNVHYLFVQNMFAIIANSLIIYPSFCLEECCCIYQTMISFDLMPTTITDCTCQNFKLVYMMRNQRNVYYFCYFNIVERCHELASYTGKILRSFNNLLDQQVTIL